ncbi:MAG: DUF3592 domain-containing protein [Luteolibacter sp.]
MTPKIIAVVKVFESQQLPNYCMPSPVTTHFDGFSVKQTTPVPSLAGRLFLIFLGLVIAALGCLFVWLMGRSFLRAYEMRKWPEMPCVILASELRERHHDTNSPAEFQQDLSFGYEWKGERHTGGHLTLRENPWSSNREEMESRAAQYKTGASTMCRVDPANPDFAVLKPDSLAPGYSIWFPALFVIGGFGISIRAAVGKKTSR